MLKIAVFYNLPSGGAKRALVEHLKKLKTRAEIVAFSTIYGETKDFLQNGVEGIKYSIYKINPPHNFFSYLWLIYIKLPQIHKKIAKKINKEGFDVALVTHDYWTKSPYILRYLNIPTVYWCHEYPREFYEPIAWHVRGIKGYLAHFFRTPLRWIDQINVQFANVIVTDSQYMKAKISQIYKRRATVIRGGVNVALFRYKRKKRENLLLSVGALSRLKGHDFVIKALAAASHGRDFILVLVGNGGRDVELFKKLAASLGVNIQIKEFISDQELLELYNKAFLLLYAPRLEPLGLVPLEAMACGLPVLGIKEGGILETVKEEVGWLVDRDVKAFARKLDWLIENEHEVEARRERARAYVVRSWSWSKASKELFNLLSSLGKSRK